MILQSYRKHREFFDSRASSWFLSQKEKDRCEEILEGIKLENKHTILDIGCGTGSLFKILRKLTSNDSIIIGMDLSYKMLHTRMHENRDQCTGILQSLGEEIPLKDQTIDVLLNYCAFPHFIYKKHALGEFYRVLKSTGRLYIIHPQSIEKTNDIHLSVGEPVSDDMLPSIDGIEKILANAHFDVRNAIKKDDLFFIEAFKSF